jgi:hypothetical protein
MGEENTTRSATRYGARTIVEGRNLPQNAPIEIEAVAQGGAMSRLSR